MTSRRIIHKLVDIGEGPRAVGLQRVKGTRACQVFQRSFANQLQLDTARKIEEVLESPVRTRAHDHLHRLSANILQRAQRIEHPAVDHCERGLRTLHAGRHDLDPHAPAFLHIDIQLVGYMQIKVHHRGHELDRMVRLQIGCLVGHHRISRRVGFVEPIVRELVEQVPNLQRLLLSDIVLGGTFEEFRTLLVHRFLDLLAHGTAQQIGPAERVTGHLPGDFHHLFLVDDDPLRLVEDVVNGRVQVVALLPPVLDVAVFGDVLHGPRPVERHQSHDVFNACRAHLAERVAHASRFHLEHAHCVSGGIEVIGRLVVQRDCRDIQRAVRQRHVLRCHQVQAVLHHGQRLEPEEVEFHKPRRFHPFHVELGCRHIRARVLVKRDQLDQRAVADHDTCRVGRGVAQQPLQLLTIVEQGFHDLFAPRLFVQLGLVLARLFD